MTRFSALLCAAVLCGLCGCAVVAPADRGDVERERVLAVDSAWSAAEVAKDVSSLDRILDDRFVFNEADGTTSGKAELMKKAAVWPMTGQTLSERTLVVDGDTAVIFGTTELRFASPARGETKALYRYTATYVRRAGTWRALAIHMQKHDPQR